PSARRDRHAAAGHQAGAAARHSATRGAAGYSAAPWAGSRGAGDLVLGPWALGLGPSGVLRPWSVHGPWSVVRVLGSTLTVGLRTRTKDQGLRTDRGPGTMNGPRPRAQGPRTRRRAPRPASTRSRCSARRPPRASCSRTPSARP